MRILVLASGRGSNFAAIADAVRDGLIPGAQLVALITNRAEAPALGLARDRGIATRVVESARFRAGGNLDRDSYESQILEALSGFHPDLVCLAGYMLLLGPTLLKAFTARIVNIHPSLLPSFRGLHAQRQAIEAGVEWAGCTVHRVIEELDAGPILAQGIVRVLPGDTEETLSTRLLPIEHETYVRALRGLVLSRGGSKART